MTARRKGLEAATRRTVVALRQVERLGSADELLVENCYFTARQLDHLDPLASPAMVASLVRAHLAATRQLFQKDVGSPDGDDDAMADALAILASVRGDASEAG